MPSSKELLELETEEAMNLAEVLEKLEAHGMIAIINDYDLTEFVQAVYGDKPEDLIVGHSDRLEFLEAFEANKPR